VRGNERFGPIVREGTWLYAGSTPTSVRIRATSIRCGTGDAEDLPEIRDDTVRAGFAVEWERAGGGGWDGGMSTQLDTIDEAIAAVAAATSGTVVWKVSEFSIRLNRGLGPAEAGHYVVEASGCSEAPTSSTSLLVLLFHLASWYRYGVLRKVVTSHSQELQLESGPHCRLATLTTTAPVVEGQRGSWHNEIPRRSKVH
jgi:hypothetical protein